MDELHEILTAVEFIRKKDPLKLGGGKDYSDTQSAEQLIKTTAGFGESNTNSIRVKISTAKLIWSHKDMKGRIGEICSDQDDAKSMGSVVFNESGIKSANKFPGIDDGFYNCYINKYFY